MAKETEYSKKLKDPRWQKKRLEIFERDKWTCRWCGSDYKTLAIHHISYLPGVDPWDYPNDLMLTVCEYCHNEEYETRSAVEARLLNAFKKYSASALDLLASAIEQQNDITYEFMMTMDWVITEPDVCKEMKTRFWDYIHSLKPQTKIKGEEDNA